LQRDSTKFTFRLLGTSDIGNGIDAYTIICGGVAARAALLDYHLSEYEAHLEEGMRSPDRTFVDPSHYRN
jgi:hypothetical protein